MWIFTSVVNMAENTQWSESNHLDSYYGSTPVWQCGFGQVPYSLHIRFLICWMQVSVVATRRAGERMTSSTNSESSTVTISYYYYPYDCMIVTTKSGLFVVTSEPLNLQLSQPSAFFPRIVIGLAPSYLLAAQIPFLREDPLTAVSVVCFCPGPPQSLCSPSSSSLILSLCDIGFSINLPND